jgi:hypothetical protein
VTRNPILRWLEGVVDSLGDALGALLASTLMSLAE